MTSLLPLLALSVRVLPVSALEANCVDGVYNDGDTATDCADPDCADMIGCVFGFCSDGESDYQSLTTGTWPPTDGDWLYRVLCCSISWWWHAYHAGC